MKKALNIDQQIAKLKSHGMEFDNEEKAKEIILDIGYYRLGFYSFPFETTFPRINNRDHKLKKGTTFKSVYDLYEFDTKLRRILLNALDRIEVNIRTQIIYTVSNYYTDSPTWFANPDIMKSDFISNFDIMVYKAMQDNPIIKRHHQRYPDDKYPPAWKTIEFMTLGNIVSLYKSIKSERLKYIIAQHYGCSTGVFINYLDTIRVIRNRCAHGSCIYNISIPIGIKAIPANIDRDSRHNINGVIAVIKYILGTISKNRKEDLNNEIISTFKNIQSQETKKIVADCTKIII